MKYFPYIASGLLVIGSTSAALAADGKVNLSLEGGYIFSGELDGHKHFGPGVVAGVKDSKHKSGAYGAISGRYSWGNQFVGLGYTYMNVDRGRFYAAPTSPPKAGIEGNIYDLEYGRPFQLGAADARWTVGLRHATFDFSTDNFAANSGPRHDFEGTGIRVALETEGAMTRPTWSWMSETGLSVLDGDIKTTPAGGWICTQCTKKSTTAVALDTKVGFNYRPNASTTYTVGYQAQYWDGVNVKYSDNSGTGQNLGTSGLITHGPFVGVNFGF